MKENIISFFYLKIFFLFVVLLIIGAVIYKLSAEITGGSFKNNSFSILIVAKESKIIYVDKNDRRALFLAVGDIEKFVKGKNPLEASFALGVPINAILVDKNPPQNLQAFTDADNEMRLVFGQEVVFKNLNRYDVHKFIGAIKAANKDNRQEIRIDLFDQKQMKEKLEEAFTDSAIRNQDITIQIDNGTTINGLGSILALILAKEGYNVIAVRTATSDVSSYIAYDDEINTYVQSLHGLTDFPIKKGKVSPAADVTIFLGDDVDAMLSP
jgi:hypothetical protein